MNRGRYRSMSKAGASTLRCSLPPPATSSSTYAKTLSSITSGECGAGTPLEVLGLFMKSWPSPIVVVQFLHIYGMAALRCKNVVAFVTELKLRACRRTVKDEEIDFWLERGQLPCRFVERVFAPDEYLHLPAEGRRPAAANGLEAAAEAYGSWPTIQGGPGGWFFQNSRCISSAGFVTFASVSISLLLTKYLAVGKPVPGLPHLW